MNMTDLQFAALTISLSTLGQADIRAVDHEQLQTLEYLLEQALENVKRALPNQVDISRRFNDP